MVGEGKFGFIKQIGKGGIATMKDLEGDISSISTLSVRANSGMNE